MRFYNQVTAGWFYNLFLCPPKDKPALPGVSLRPYQYPDYLLSSCRRLRRHAQFIVTLLIISPQPALADCWTTTFSGYNPIWTSLKEALDYSQQWHENYWRGRGLVCAYTTDPNPTAQSVWIREPVALFVVLNEYVTDYSDPGTSWASGIDGGSGVPVSYRRHVQLYGAHGETCPDFRTDAINVSYYWNIVGLPAYAEEYNRLCRSPSYRVKLSRPDDSSVNEVVLDQIEPSKTTTLVAKVYDRNNQLVPNVDVKLTLEAKRDSGGHHHGDDTVTLRSGTINGQQVLTGNTGPNGFQFEYKAPGVGGDVDLNAICINGKNCTPQGPKQVWAGYKGLQSLSIYNYRVYKLVGQTDTHPDNHYLTLTADSRVTVFAAMYQLKYPQRSVLHLNDASLERGGIFDLFPESSPNWKGPHFQHCRGTVIDIRANGEGGALNITSDDDPMILRIKELGAIVGADPVWEVPEVNKKPVRGLRHFHTKLMGQEGIQCP